MIKSKTCVRLLVGVHLALGIFTAVFGNLGLIPHLTFRVLLIGIFLGQAISAGLWAGLSNHSAPRRIVQGFFAAGLIWAFGVTACHGWTMGGAKIALLLWIVVPWAAVALAGNVLRRYDIRCAPTETGLADSPPEGIQFSLRQLAIMVATCAILLSLVRGLHNAGTALTIASFLLAAGAFAIAFALQALACLWAALGAGAWIRRIWLPLLLALIWAPLLAFASGGHSQLYLSWTAPVQAMLAGLSCEATES